MSLTLSLTREQMLKEMDRALADEIAQQNQQNSSKSARHTATDGTLVSKGNGQYIYTFSLDEPWEPQDDTPLRITNASGKEIKCSVVTAKGTLITIASDTPFSEELLQRIDFLDDSTELLKRQREALKKLQEGERFLTSKSFGLLPSQMMVAPIEKRLSQQTSLRDQQYYAASKALGGEITFIVGPPGTGKTLTLAAVAFTHLREGRSVLIAAHTNIAIDNAIMKLYELCKDAGRDDLLEQGQVVRFGAVQKAELKSGISYQEVYLPEIVKRLNEQVQQEYNDVIRALNELKDRIGTLLQQRKMETQQYQRVLEQCTAQYDQLQATLRPLETQERQHRTILKKQHGQYHDSLQQFQNTWLETSQHLAQTKAFLVEQSNAHISMRQQEQDTLQRLLDARTMNGMQRFFRQVNLEKLEQQAGEATYQAHQILLSIQIAQDDETHYQDEMGMLDVRIKDFKKKIEQIEQQLNTPSAKAADIERLQSELAQAQYLYDQQKNLLDQAEQLHQPELQTFRQQQQQWETHLSVLDQQMRDIEKKIVENARVVGTTLTKTYINQAMSSRRFDAVILDEVSAASLPLIYLATTRADRSVTFIGDPQQLAPVANAETLLVEKWLKNDLFNFRSISLEIASQGLHHSTLLTVQSRMHPQIARIANTLIYHNKLVDDFNTSTFKPIFPLPDVPVVLCDTQDAAPTVSRPRNGKSRRNYYHALYCLELAKQVQRQLSDNSEWAAPKVGIITPYAPQARLIQNLLKDTGLQQSIQAGTVHKFQGLEFDTVIFDTVESPGLPPGEFITGSFGSNTMRLINVAITRARYKLFIVAHQRHILQTFPETAILKKVVQYAAASAVYSSLDTIGTPLATALQKARMQQIPPGQVLSKILNEEEILVLYPAEETERTEVSQYNEKTFYEACKHDLSLAHESIIIASPFLSPRRVEELLPLLLEKQQQGIKMTIYTKPLDECNEWWHRKAAQMLLDAGLPLIYCPEMHQKAVMLDKKTLYHGSLNLLSQHKSGESMLRLMKQSRLIEVLNEELQTPVMTQQKGLTLTEEEIRHLKTISVPLSHLPALTSTCACGSSFVPRLRKDGSGVFFGCKNYSRCTYKNTANVTKEQIQQIQLLQNKSCAQCRGTLELQFQEKPLLILLSCGKQCEEKQCVVFTR